MADEPEVQLSPASVPMVPGASPVEVTITIRNQTDGVSEYGIELIGLEVGWFTPPPSSVRIFPQERDQLRFSLRPPRSATKGSYLYRVVVRSRNTSSLASAEGTLEIGGTGAYRLEVLPRSQTGRGQGEFKAQLTSTGTADLRVTLDGRDADGNCDVRFSHDAPIHVRVGQKVDVPLRVRPFKRPWIGAEQRFNFNITAHPDDPTVAPQTVAGQFTHKPWLQSAAPIRRTLLVIGGVAVALALIAVLLPSGVAGPIGTVRGWVCEVPIVGSLCGARSAAPTCAYDAGFKDYADAAAQLIGPCVTQPLADSFGNVRQYSRNGVLFWQHDSNTVYFFKGDSLYAFLDDKSVLIHGSGAS